MKGRAVKRAKTEAKVKRAVKILIQRGMGDLPPTQPPWQTLHISARKFATSHFGCACGMCMNPRRMYRGKNKASLTRKELNVLNRKDEE